MSTKNIAADALENETPAKVKINKNINESKIDASNIEWLTNENVLDHIDKDDNTIVSSKYNEEREIKVQNGLKNLETLEIGGKKLNPLIILMAKWWEHKGVRKEIKALLDKEAEEKGYSSADYLQNVLGAEIDVFAENQTAIDRIKYAKTYFIPRGGIKSTLKTRQMTINGDLYNVPIAKLAEIQAKYPTYKTDPKVAKKMRLEVIEVSELNTSVEEL